MIYITEINENNIEQAKKLEVSEKQKNFLDNSVGIIKRAEDYKRLNPHLFGIAKGEELVGMALVKDFAEEPFGYDLQQFMIDKSFQNKGWNRSIETYFRFFKKRKTPPLTSR